MLNLSNIRKIIQDEIATAKSWKLEYCTAFLHHDESVSDDIVEELKDSGYYIEYTKFSSYISIYWGESAKIQRKRNERFFPKSDIEIIPWYRKSLYELIFN